MKKSKPKRKSRSEEPNLPKAFLFGLGAAVISCIIWFAAVAGTHWQFGLIAVVVGFFIGKSVIYGAGYKSSGKIQAIAIVLTLLSMIVSEYLISVYLINQESTSGEEFYSYLQPPGFIAYRVYDSLIYDPLTLIFWAIALYEAYALTKVTAPDKLLKETIEGE